MQNFTTHSSLETQEIASKLARKLILTGGVVALYGDLGAGKTTFTQGFAKTLGINDRIISPTFILLKHYPIPNLNGKKPAGSDDMTLFHLDLYRLENLSAIKEIGLEDIINNSNAIVLIEWAEKAEQLLPEQTIRVKIEKVQNDLREITINPPTV